MASLGVVTVNPYSDIDSERIAYAMKLGAWLFSVPLYKARDCCLE